MGVILKIFDNTFSRFVIHQKKKNKRGIKSFRILQKLMNEHKKIV